MVIAIVIILALLVAAGVVLSKSFNRRVGKAIDQAAAEAGKLPSLLPMKLG